VLAVHAVEEKRMFGSLAFMLGGNIVCGIREDTLFVRVGHQDWERAMSEPNVDQFPPTSSGNRPMKGFVTIEPAGIADDENLSSWIATGLAFVATLPPKPGKG
jgi:TfoX/Sxy family transcriptional regulator of competence genes